MILMVTRPQHDVTTRYLSAWAGEIVSFARSRGIEVIDLFREKANRQAFEGRMRKVSPELVFLNGHGGADCVSGHNDETLLKAHENHAVLRGAIIYALSCSSGKILGPLAVGDAQTSYIGYNDEFIFIADRTCITKPLLDRKAKPFMESSNQVMIALLKGHDTHVASERSKYTFMNNYIQLLASSTDPDSLQAAQCLWWNMQHQVCLGDRNASISIEEKL